MGNFSTLFLTYFISLNRYWEQSTHHQTQTRQEKISVFYFQLQVLKMKLSVILVVVALGIFLGWEQEGVEARMNMGLGSK